MTLDKVTKNRFASLAVGIMLLIVGYFIIITPLTNDRTVLRVDGGNTFVVDVADEPNERYQGLSGRTSLGDQEGMLFAYDSPGNYSFVMRDMLFALDFVWIDSSKVITELTKNVPPSSYPDETYASTKPSQYILEVNAGTIDREGFEVGDQVEFNL